MKQRFASTVLIMLVLACLVFFTLAQDSKNKRLNKIISVHPTQTFKSSANSKKFVATKTSIPIIAYHYIEVVTDERDFIR